MRKMSTEAPANIIKDSTLQGEARGRVRELSGLGLPNSSNP